MPSPSPGRVVAGQGGDENGSSGEGTSNTVRMAIDVKEDDGDGDADESEDEGDLFAQSYRDASGKQGRKV